MQKLCQLLPWNLLDVVLLRQTEHLPLPEHSGLEPSALLYLELQILAPCSFGGLLMSHLPFPKGFGAGVGLGAGVGGFTG